MRVLFRVNTSTELNCAWTSTCLGTWQRGGTPACAHLDCVAREPRLWARQAALVAQQPVGEGGLALQLFKFERVLY